MTIDEAHLVLNAKRSEDMERILQVTIPHLSFGLLTITHSSQNYEHLFKANSPPGSTTLNPKPAGSHALRPPAHSHYLQSKVVWAHKRIQAGVPTTGHGAHT